jgi:glycolate oxidase FAD binding subunit
VVGERGGGQAILIRVRGEARATIPVFEPQPQGLAALSRRLKAAFDPYAILEPCRMWPEF